MSPLSRNMEGSLQLHFAAIILSVLAVTCHAHNITSILAGYPEFSLFNDYITRTKVADDINTRTTITVLVVDNEAMSANSLLGLGLETAQHVMSLHVLLDYLDATKLHSITSGSMLSTTLFQTTGVAEDMMGLLNITDLKGGVVAFEVPGSNTVAATLVKSIYSDPYNISVVQISKMMAPPGLLTPSVPASSVNISALLANTGHAVFARLITAAGVLDTYQDIVNGGLTVFAPVDGAFDGAMTDIQKLSSAQLVSMLEYHARPVYSPLGTLKSTNGDAVTTVATNGAERYLLNVGLNGDSVILGTGVNSAAITSTVLDDQPLVVFSIDKVLMPPEIFAAPVPRHAPSHVPAPTPAVRSHVAAPTPAVRSPVPVSSSPSPVSSAMPPVSSPSAAVSRPPQQAFTPPAPPAESPLSSSAPGFAPTPSPSSEKSSAFRVSIGVVTLIPAVIYYMVFGRIF